MEEIRSLCPFCFEEFQARVRRQSSGLVKYLCAKKGIAVTAYVENGVVMNWVLSPGPAPTCAAHPAKPHGAKEGAAPEVKGEAHSDKKSH